MVTKMEGRGSKPLPAQPRTRRRDRATLVSGKAPWRAAGDSTQQPAAAATDGGAAQRPADNIFDRKPPSKYHFSVK